MEAGYIRIDPLDVNEHSHWGRASGGIPFLRIKPLTELHSKVILAEALANSSQSTVCDYELVPPWKPVLVLVKRGMAFADPYHLLDALSGLSKEGSVTGMRTSSSNSRSDIMFSTGGNSRNSSVQFVEDVRWIAVSPLAPISSSLDVL
eukprot:gene38603-50700_t